MVTCLKLRSARMSRRRPCPTCCAIATRFVPETADRVLKAIAELGYRPNLNARALAEGRSSTLALDAVEYLEPVLSRVRAGGRTRGAQGRPFPDGLQYRRRRRDRPRLSEPDRRNACRRRAGHEHGHRHQRACARRPCISAPILLAMWEHPEAPPALPCVAVDFAHAGALAAQRICSNSAIARSAC